MSDLIVVFGGSGFLGKHVVKALAKAGKRVRVAMRRPHLGHELRVFGDVGQVQIVQANVRYPDSIKRALEGADGVVNLIGVLTEKGAQNFKALHVEAPAAIARAAQEAGVTRFVHVSALGVDKSAAKYAKTKLAGEQAVRDVLPGATVLRPSIIFGPGDSFFNRFADMAKFAPVLPLIGGKCKFQPVFVGDVAAAIVAGLDRANARGKTFELGGPQTYSMQQLLAYICNTIDRPRPLFPVALFIMQPFGMLIDAVCKLPLLTPPITGDQIVMLRTDNVVSPDAPGFAELGVSALESVEAIVPSYLWRFRPYGQFRTKQRPA